MKSRAGLFYLQHFPPFLDAASSWTFPGCLGLAPPSAIRRSFTSLAIAMNPCSGQVQAADADSEATAKGEILMQVLTESTLMFCFALVSKNFMGGSNSAASASPSSLLTCLSSAISHLLPMRILFTCTSACCEVQGSEDLWARQQRFRAAAHLLYLPNPIADAIERSPICHVVHQQYTLGAQRRYRMSAAKTAARGGSGTCAPRKYEVVIVRKRSCPAVSHICGSGG